MGHIFLYGPPASGKLTVGKLLASSLSLPFLDLDNEIEKETGYSISQIIENQGEDSFRNLESAVLERASTEFYECNRSWRRRIDA